MPEAPQWLSTKYLRAHDEMALGTAKRISGQFRKVARIEIWGSMKHIYFTDGGRFDCGSATKLWIRKPTAVTR